MQTLNKLRDWMTIGTKTITVTLLRWIPGPIKDLAKKVIFQVEKQQIVQHQLLLHTLLQKYTSDTPIIIFPPSLDWNVQLFQRPQQLALALARQGACVFYLQPHPNRRMVPFEPLSERMYLCNVNVHVFEALAHPFVYLLTWNSDYAHMFREPQIIYDFVDDIDVFYGDRNKMLAGHQSLLRDAKVVLATAKRLVEQIHAQRADVIYCPNGVVYEQFDLKDQSISPPPEIQPILDMHKPIIGYYGALARWFDYELLKEVAKQRPNYMFLLIGPDYDGTIKSADLDKYNNIIWLGVKPYEQLPHYLYFFDVATIPFQVNEVTHAVSPLKLFEYMAGGKPIVVTPMEESMNYPGVLVGDSPQSFLGKIDYALSIKNDSKYIRQLKETAYQNTWDARAKLILSVIQNKGDLTLTQI